MQLKSIEVENLLSFEKASIDIKEGLWLVEGVNTDNDLEGYSSNGSGKSSLFSEAPSWCFFDVTARGIKHDDVIRIANPLAKSCRVKIILEDGNEDFAIERIRQRGKGSKVTVNGELYTQEKLENLLGINFDSFIAAIVHAQNYQGFADKKDKDRKAILTNILGLERFDAYKDMAKSLSDENKKEVIVIEERATQHKYAINGLEEEIEDFKVQAEGFEEDRKKKKVTYETLLKDEQDRKSRIKKTRERRKELIEEVEKASLALENLRDSKEKLSQKLGVVTDDYNKLKEQKAVINSNIKQNSKNIKKPEDFKDAVCPTCSQEVGEEHLAVCNEVYEEEIEKLIVQEQTLDKEIAKVKEEGDAVKVADEALQEQRADARSFISNFEGELKGLPGDEEWEEVCTKITGYEDLIKELEQDIVNPYKELLKKKQKQLEGTSDTIDSLKKELQELQDLQGYYDYWVMGFGDKGIKSFIFDSIIPEFTIKANKYIQGLTESNITLNMDTQTAKKGGGYSEKFNITITDGVGSRPYESWSGGEKRRISIAIDLALSDLIASRTMKNWQWACFDEMFDGLDEDGKARTVELLQEMQTNFPSIYVISHDATLKELFPNRVTVIKEDGISKIGDIK